VYQVGTNKGMKRKVCNKSRWKAANTSKDWRRRRRRRRKEEGKEKEEEVRWYIPLNFNGEITCLDTLYKWRN